jgi:uncharacterized protein (DUF58 family)
MSDLAHSDEVLSVTSSSSVEVVFGKSGVWRHIAPTARGWSALLAILCVTAVAVASLSAAVVALDASLAVAIAAALWIIVACRCRPGRLRAVLSAPPFAPKGMPVQLDVVVSDLAGWGCSVVMDPSSAHWSRGRRMYPDRERRSIKIIAPAARHRVPVRAENAGTSQLAEFPVPTSRRGIYECRGVTLWLSDPLGLFGVRLATFSELAVVVHPVTFGGADLRLEPLLRERDDANAGGVETKGGGVDLLGVRPYQRGDRLSSVHWRSLAGTAPLLVRELGEELERPVRLFIDDRVWVHRRPAFERAVDLLTGAVATWPHTAQPIELRSLSSGRAAPVVGGLTPALLEWLAVLEPRESGSRNPEAARSLGEIGPGDTVFTTVTASRSLGSLREQGARLVVAQ